MLHVRLSLLLLYSEMCVVYICVRMHSHTCHLLLHLHLHLDVVLIIFGEI